MHASAVPPAHLTDPHARTAAAEDRPTFDLSVRQLLASVAAAVTAAILGSRLGVAGTLIGAALASAITMIASAVYSHSLAAAQYRVRQARVTQLIEQDAPTQVIPMPQQAWGLLPPAVQPVVPPLAVPTMPHRIPSVTAPARDRRMPRWAMAGVGTLVACALALLTVTGIEAVRGGPLSGGTSGGLSVLGGHSAGVADTTSKTTVPRVESSTGASSTAGTGSDTAQTTTNSAATTVTVTATDPAGTSTASSSSRSSTTSSTTATPTDSPAPTSASTPITTAQTPSSIGNPVR